MDAKRIINWIEVEPNILKGIQDIVKENQPQAILSMAEQMKRFVWGVLIQDVHKCYAIVTDCVTTTMGTVDWEQVAKHFAKKSKKKIMIKTTSLELSKQLKEAGFPQKDSTFYWEESTPKATHLTEKIVQLAWNDDIAVSADLSYGANHPWQNDSWNSFAAPTAEEILERLPAGLGIGKHNNGYSCLLLNAVWENKFKLNNRQLYEISDSIVAAEAAGKMWLYLKERKLI